MTQWTNEKIRKAVRDQYGEIAASSHSGCGCSATTCCDKPGSDANTISMELGYTNREIHDVPDSANMGLGCGNPQAIASLKKGEIVLDLGSGGGIDCFLAGKAVGESGHVIGVDMTPEMISRARNSSDISDHKNVEFRLGEIEYLPVADATVDVIISNCVINLSPDKASVFREAYRVLKPGGRLAIADVVAATEMSKKVKNDMSFLTGCRAGASAIPDLEYMLKNAGFEAVEIAPKIKSRRFIRDGLPNRSIKNDVVSAIIKAIKPRHNPTLNPTA